MTRPHAPSGISRESLNKAIEHAALLGLARSAYEAWAEYITLDPTAATDAEPQLAPATRLSVTGIELIVREPLAIGTRLMVRLVQPDASTGRDQCAFVQAIEPGQDPRWWRCSLCFIHPEDSAR